MQSDGTRIPLLSRNGSIVGYTVVDDTDAEWVQQWTWRLHHPTPSQQYAKRYLRDGDTFVCVALHRELMGLPRRGRDPQVDHVNKDGLDNRRANLRVVTQAENLQNKHLYRRSTSGYRGVHWHKVMQKWLAHARLNGTLHYIGYYSTAEEANAAAKAWRREHMTHTVED